MSKYALRYAPLLILALLIIPLRVYMAGSAQQAGNGQQYPGFPLYQASSPSGHYSALYSITMLPSGDTWAVGGSFSLKPVGQDTSRGVPVPSSGMILHYTGNAWVAANVAAPLRLPLLSVSLNSPRDGWAVGWAGTLVHFDGNTWSTVPGPAKFKQNLLGIVMHSPSDGWAVGYSGSILHYDGKQWIQVQSPTTVDLRGVAMPSAQEGWAVGDSGTILHYHDGTWSIASPSPTSNTLDSISMLSTAEGWIVGRQGTILHYRDGTWESVHPAGYYRNPNVYQSADFYGVDMNSIRSGWIAAGQHFLIYSSEVWIEPGNAINPLNGAYPGKSSNNLSLYATAMSPAGEGWAVGSMYSYKIFDTGVILHYHGGKWAVSLLTG